MKLDNLTIESAHRGLMKKEFSAVELAKFYLNKIKKENKKLNAFLEITEKLALEQAKKVDNKIKHREKIGGIEGIPIAIKDNILVEGHKCTAGSKILENYTATYDATVIKKLKQAGAVILGKTNLDEFGMGSSTENSAFGPTKNPIDITRVPGGSSGGSTAAVAADQCIAALGSDTASSIRQPAALCGVVGFKPTYGMVSRYGLIAMTSSLDQIGPIAKTVEDAKLIFDIIKGRDEMDSTSVEHIKHQIKSNIYKNFKIGIPKEYFGESTDKEVGEIINKAIKNYEKIGAKIIEVSLPLTDYALSVYHIVMPAEVSTNLARYDGIKYGLRKQAKNLLEQYLTTRANGFGNEARRRIILGAYILSAGYKDAYYNKAKKIRLLIEKEFKNIFKEVDVLMTPTAPTPAFKIGEKQDPLVMYLSDIYTAPANIGNVPAISIPCGKVGNLPIGLQIIGPQFYDELVFETAQIYGQLSE